MIKSIKGNRDKKNIDETLVDERQHSREGYPMREATYLYCATYTRMKMNGSSPPSDHITRCALQ